MKKLRNYLMLLACALMAAGSLTSCISDGDDDTIDPADYAKYLTYMSGTYTGKARFFYTKSSQTTLLEKYDSISNSVWFVRTDSTVTMNIPVCKLDSAISNNSQYASLKKAIRNCTETKQLKALYWIPSTQYVSTNSISFIVNPALLTADVEYDGAKHTVAFMFYPNYYGGTWSTGAFQYMMVLARIYPDYQSSTNTGSYLSSESMRTVAISFAKE